MTLDTWLADTFFHYLAKYLVSTRTRISFFTSSSSSTWLTTRQLYQSSFSYTIIKLTTHVLYTKYVSSICLGRKTYINSNPILSSPLKERYTSIHNFLYLIHHSLQVIRLLIHSSIHSFIHSRHQPQAQAYQVVSKQFFTSYPIRSPLIPRIPNSTIHATHNPFPSSSLLEHLRFVLVLRALCVPNAIWYAAFLRADLIETLLIDGLWKQATR